MRRYPGENFRDFRDRRFNDKHDFGDLRDHHFRIHAHKQRSRVFFGIVVAIVGVGLLLRTAGILPYFSFDVLWPLAIIFFGLLIGLKTGFRRVSSWLLILIGLANLTPEFKLWGHPSHDFAWPALIIVGGLLIAFRPRRRDCFPRRPISTAVHAERSVNIDVTFGGKKEVVTSKDFTGGLVSVTFAGCELNLTQADFTTPEVILDFRVSFGGVELIIPSNWEIQNEIQPSFGSVEDERTIIGNINTEAKKILVMRGTVSFGNIEIKSY